MSLNQIALGRRPPIASEKLGSRYTGRRDVDPAGLLIQHDLNAPQISRPSGQDTKTLRTSSPAAVVMYPATTRVASLGSPRNLKLTIKHALLRGLEVPAAPSSVDLLEPQANLPVEVKATTRTLSTETPGLAASMRRASTIWWSCMPTGLLPLCVLRDVASIIAPIRTNAAAKACVDLVDTGPRLPWSRSERDRSWHLRRASLPMPYDAVGQANYKKKYKWPYSWATCLSTAPPPPSVRSPHAAPPSALPARACPPFCPSAFAAGLRPVVGVAPSSISPVAILMTWTALPITSAGRLRP